MRAYAGVCGRMYALERQMRTIRPHTHYTHMRVNTHTHASAAPGSPTSPPLLPTNVSVQPLVTQLISTTVTVQN